MRFDEAEYWRLRGDRYVAEFATHTEATQAIFSQQEKRLREVLGGLDLSGARSVLEVGCGFGRLTGILLDVLPDLERYTGIDISPRQIEAARRAAQGRHVPMEFVQGDFRSTELEPADLVFAGEVFLHFPPSEISGVLERALGLGRQLVHLDPYVPQPALTPSQRARWLVWRWRGHMPLHGTDWQHDYPRLYPTCEVMVFPVGVGQHLFVVRRPAS